MASEAISLSASEAVEVGLHEIGESLALALGAVQDELGMYQGQTGSFIVDDFTLEIPLQLRIDGLGQSHALVVSKTEAGQTYTRLSFKVRPVLGATASPLPLLSHKPLAVLRFIPDYAIERLAEFRVFSVADLQRVIARPAGVQALREFDIDVRQVQERIDVLSLPLDPRIAEALLEMDVSSPEQFMKVDPEELAHRLTDHLGQEVLAEDIKRVQQQVREVNRFRFPGESEIIG